ncbi:MAG: glycosyltransferase family 2 protein [bacterium]
MEKVSVIIPCYNESETLGEFYKRISSLAEGLSGYQFEFIFINDGSQDGTWEILNNLAGGDNRVKVLHFAHNRGHQMAITAGMDFARGNIIVTIDADLQDPPAFIKDMLAKIKEGYDVVHAQRSARAGETRFKLYTARFFYSFIRKFSEIPLIENSGDFRAFTRPVLKAAGSFREPHRFLRGNFVLFGFKQCTITYERDSRFAGKTKYPLKKMTKFAMDAILSFSSVPLQFVLLLAFIMWSFTLIYLGKAVFLQIFFDANTPGWTSLIVLMSFYTALILFSLAIIGSYVGRIFEQGQKRPLYWLSDIRNIDIDEIVSNSVNEPVELSISSNILKAKKK